MVWASMEIAHLPPFPNLSRETTETAHLNCSFLWPQRTVAQQYFFKKIINVVKTVGSGAVDLAKVVGKTVEDTIKAAKSFYSFEETPTTKAADILQKLAVKDLSLYALEDGKAYNDFRHHFAEKLSRVAEPLIKKGEALCSCRGRTQLDEIEAKFVDVVVKAF
ncbi:hypothetical protein HPB51_016110 [Rhipicephalus microplus]|uniref:Uncharacterized protein n=1 Tax=Rhipicephalus microplus TaxID=6941 RepID=A0A9J6D5N5_RHIMP|nr:hypothetical protein HPB51_016110 [Rhipicephalus microplus]